MVINKDYFMLKIKELKTLMNASGNWDNFAQEAFKHIYGKTYTAEDFDAAIDTLLEGEHTRMTFPVLIGAMNKARATRFNKESQAKQMQEITDRQMFWDKRKEIRHEPCLDRHCGSCAPEKAKYCDDVAMRTLALIKEKFSMEDCQWSINDRLNEEFPGYGFEKKISARHQWAKKVNGEIVSCDAHGITGQERPKRSYQAYMEEATDFTQESTYE